MSRIFSRTIVGMSAYASVVTSPATCTWPVVMSVSTATRLFGSCESRASRMESLIASAILSGWPSVTDSDVNRRRDTSAPYGLGSSGSLVALADRSAVHLIGRAHARVVHRARCGEGLPVADQRRSGHPV